VGTVRTATVALILALAGIGALGQPALADPTASAPPSAAGSQITLPAAPIASALASTGAGTATQQVTIAVPTGGIAVLVDSTGQDTTSTVVPAVGEFRIERQSGVLTFDPVFGYTGSPCVDYRITDAYEQSSTSTYTPTVVPPAAPEAPPETTRAAANVQQVTRVAVPVGATLTLLAPDGAQTNHVFLPGQGNYAFDPASETITFTPGQGFYGVGSLTYQLTDAYGQTARNAYTPVVLRPRSPQEALVGKTAKPVVTATQPVVLIPPIELVRPSPTASPKPTHRATARHRISIVTAKTRPAVHHPKPLPTTRTVVPAQAPTVETVVQDLAEAPAAVASPATDTTHPNGRLAGLMLIVVNLFVALAALALNRRRRSS
jgi:CshA-type fibril repeat protein